MTYLCDLECTLVGGCQGASGDGQGITSKYGVPGIANFHLDPFKAAYPDGRMFEVITHGKGNMGAYKHNVSLRDRWAIVAYVRALQLARKAPLTDPVKAALAEAGLQPETAAQ